MNDFDGLDELSEAEAAVIVAGMRMVAKADGDVHANELALIEELGKDLPLADPNTKLGSQDARRVYIRSLGMLALADGVLSSTEVALIRELAHRQGLTMEQVDGELRSVKRRFFEKFSGVVTFKDQARSIGEGLGLSSEEIDDVLMS